MDNFFSDLCMNCMEHKGDNEICPYCGSTGEIINNLPAIKVGTIVQDRYIVGTVINENSAIMTYLGFDMVNKQKIEINEFLPQSICSRADTSLDVLVDESNKSIFDKYKESFLSYSKKIANMRELSAIETLYDIFEENGTAYTISHWDEGVTLKKYIEDKGGRLEWNDARLLFMPLISSLSAFHKQGIGHYGLSIDNIIVTNDKKLKLMGICFDAVRKQNNVLLPELYDGQSALEQYEEGCELTEATDIYSFTAILFYALTGKMPKSAIDRKKDERLLIESSIVNQMPKHLVLSLSKGLQVNPLDRYSTFEDMRDEISMSPKLTVQQANSKKNTKKTYAQTQKQQYRKALPDFVVGIISFVISFFVFALIAWAYLMMTDKSNEDTSSSSSIESSDITSSTDDETSSTEEVSSTGTIATGQIRVPKLLGESLDNAKNGVNYKVVVSDRVFNDNMPEGTIISQDISEGTAVNKGAIISVVVSLGSQMRKLPNITNMTLDKAKVEISKAGFVFGKATEQSSTQTAGTVISYANNSYVENTELEYGTIIDVIVSKGK